MKNIVFIDHDIENFHAKTFARLIGESGGAFRLAGVCANRQDNLKEWATRFDCPCADDIRRFEGIADYVMVLAPSNPETHPDLCRKAFRLGKPTYVDKTFAADPDAALKIFAMADEAGVAVQSSSVLRYTEVQDFCLSAPENRPDFVATWGGGTDFQEYIIHQVEMAVSLMGAGFESLRTEKLGNIMRVDLGFAGGRAAAIHMAAPSEIAFSATVSNPLSTRTFVVDEGRLFASGMAAILNFFDAGRALVAREETLAIMRILEDLKMLRS